MTNRDKKENLPTKEELERSMKLFLQQMPRFATTDTFIYINGKVTNVSKMPYEELKLLINR